MKKRLHYFLSIAVVLACLTNCAYAIEEVNDSGQNNDIKNTINKNIVSPNESPGILLDTDRTKRYFESLEDAHRTEFNIFKPEDAVIQDDTITLPARIDTTAPTTRVKQVIFSDSKIFDELEITRFTMLLENKDVTAEDLNNFINIINNQYLKKKVVTARASLESFENGILKIELMEAKIGKIYVEGNRFNRKWFLKKMVSAKPDQVLNLAVLENDLQTFNKNARSIQMSAQLKPGEKYGTTDIVLKADEKLPYHFSASWDSFGRDSTGLLRGGLMASADSLFGFQDRLTFAINMAKASTNPFVDYSIPINRRGTRAGLSYMYGKSKVISGDYGNYDLYATTHVFSGYINHPLVDKPRWNLSWNTSANIKLSTADISGYTYSNYKDYNIATGLSGRYNFNKSVLFGSLYSTNGIIKDEIRDETKFFTKLNADGYYIHYLPKGIILTGKIGGQYTPNDVPFIEQYQIGGISSVRGYTESLLLAANSYYASLEMLFPIPFLPEEIKIPFRKDGSTYRLRDSFKLAAFYDTGAIFPNDNTTITKANFLMSVGAGIRIAISKYLTARVYFGVPLMNQAYYSQSGCRVHFDVVASPL